MMVSPISSDYSRPAIRLGSAAFPLFQSIRIRLLGVRKGKPWKLTLCSLFHHLASLLFLCCFLFSSIYHSCSVCHFLSSLFISFVFLSAPFRVVRISINPLSIMFFLCDPYRKSSPFSFSVFLSVITATVSWGYHFSFGPFDHVHELFRLLNLKVFGYRC
jgi:hypothetical protein